MNTPDQPAISDIQVGLTNIATDPPTVLTKSKTDAEMELVELDGRRQFYNLRSEWSSACMSWIWLMLAFQFLLTGLIGFKAIDFKDYPYFLPIVTIQTFLQIVGMGYVIVKFLYPGANQAQAEVPKV